MSTWKFGLLGWLAWGLTGWATSQLFKGHTHICIVTAGFAMAILGWSFHGPNQNFLQTQLWQTCISNSTIPRYRFGCDIMLPLLGTNRFCNCHSGVSLADAFFSIHFGGFNLRLYILTCQAVFLSSTLQLVGQIMQILLTHGHHVFLWDISPRNSGAKWFAPVVQCLVMPGQKRTDRQTW